MSDEEDIIQRMQDVEIRSEDVQEIMGFIPHWIIRWGITIIFIVVFGVVIGSNFFKYPDVIQSMITLTTETPPATLVARAPGKIQALFVQDKQKVNKDDYIAVIENATDYRHLFQVNEKLASLHSFFSTFESIPSVDFEKNLSLGQLQSAYTSFYISYMDYQLFVQLNYHQKKIDSIKEQISRYNTILEQTERQNVLMEQELALSRENFERSKSLFKDGIISRGEYDAAQSVYIQKQYSFEGVKTSRTNSKLQITQLEQSIMELEMTYRSEKKRIQLSLSQAYENMTGQISQWEQTYVLKAPISGTVTFTKYWSINQNVMAGDKVVTIIPGNGGKIIGKLVLPTEGSGKVKIGQKVNIKLNNYPYMDFGIVSGIIVSKSLVASDNFYTLEVDLPHGLETSYGKTLDFSQEMTGFAEIITEDLRLLDRVFKPIKALMKQP